jgi:hypothetical protein
MNRPRPSTDRRGYERTIVRDHRPGDLHERGRLALPDLDRLALRRRQLPAGLLGDRALDVLDQPVGLPVVAADEQPAGTLRHLPADQQDAEAEPTMVTSSPSRIQTVPRPTSTIQCQRAHGRRSSRDGTSVRIVPVSGRVIPDLRGG